MSAAVSFFRALCRLVSGIFQARTLFASEALVAARVATCVECPLFQPDQRRCGACGCFVDIKAALLQERCPADPDRWTFTRIKS